MKQNTSRCSAQIFYAETLLEFMPEQGYLRASIENAAWLCLKESWLAWLKELPLLISPKSPMPGSADSLEALVNLMGDSQSEIQRLINLKSSPSSWLSVMLKRFETGDYVNGQVEHAPNTASAFIPISSVDAVDQDMSVKDIISAFKAYMAEVKAHTLEW